MNRYARQMILPQVGEAGQKKLASAKILVIGAGGLAAPSLPLLAGAGIGHITIVDGDAVSLSNLHRQTLFKEAECGSPKAEAAAARLRSLNSEITVDSHSFPLTPDNAPSLIANADCVLDCADSYAASYTLNDVCHGTRTPLISASVLSAAGYVGGFCGGAPSLRAVFPDAPDSGASCATAGVFGPVVGIMGSLQAQMALSVILGLNPSPLGQMVQFDAVNFRSTSFRFDSAREPAKILPFAALSQLMSNDMIVELRGIEEAPSALHPEAERILPDQVVENLPSTNRRLVLCCATGLRSWRTAERVRQVWPGEILLVAASAC